MPHIHFMQFLLATYAHASTGATCEFTRPE